MSGVLSKKSEQKEVVKKIKGGGVVHLCGTYHPNNWFVKDHLDNPCVYTGSEGVIGSKGDQGLPGPPGTQQRLYFGKEHP